MDFTHFRNNLRDLMDSHGLSMLSLAKEINSTPATVSRYLSANRTPDLDYVVRIAAYFNVPIDWLLGFDGEKHAPIPREHQELIELYSKASVDDKRIIQLILQKYREKE